MRYFDRWKARGLRVGTLNGIVRDKSGVIGHLLRNHSPGTRSPGGLRTNVMWLAKPAKRSDVRGEREFNSMTQALAYLLGEEVMS